MVRNIEARNLVQAGGHLRKMGSNIR